MTYEALILYPAGEDATFDLDYYLTTHIDLAKKTWSPMGLKGYEIVQMTPGPDGSRGPYAVVAIMHWNNAKEAGMALASEASKAVFGDLHNFSNKRPVFVGGNVVGSSSEASS